MIKYDKADHYQLPPFNLASGFLVGLGAIGLLGAFGFNPPRYPSGALARDMAAINGDVRQSLRKLGELESSEAKP